MSAKNKQTAVFFFIITLLSVFLIASALPNMVFNPGVPIPNNQSQTGGSFLNPPQSLALDKEPLNIYGKVFLDILLIITGIFAGYVLIKKLPWKVIMRTYLLAVSGVLVFLVFCGVLLSIMNPSPELEPTEPESRLMFTPIPLNHNNINQTNFAALDMDLVVWIGLGFIIFLLIFLLVFMLINWHREKMSKLDAVQLGVEQAIQALKSGSELRNVILHCYKQMSQALLKEQGLEMEKAMTAREFEELLEQRGIPHDPVKNLTLLFESARYGLDAPTQQDEQNALGCLNDILAFSHQKRPAIPNE